MCVFFRYMEHISLISDIYQIYLGQNISQTFIFDPSKSYLAHAFSLSKTYGTLQYKTDILSDLFLKTA